MANSRWLQDTRPGRTHLIHRWNEIQAKHINMREISAEIAAEILAKEGVDISNEILADQNAAADARALEDRTAEIRENIANNRAEAERGAGGGEPQAQKTAQNFERTDKTQQAGEGDEVATTPDDETVGAGDTVAGDAVEIVGAEDKSGVKLDIVGASNDKPAPVILPLAKPVDIIAAVNRLDTTDDKMWVGGGLPRVDSVLAELGEGVSVTRPAITEATGGATRDTLSGNASKG